MTSPAVWGAAGGALAYAVVSLAFVSGHLVPMDHAAEVVLFEWPGYWTEQNIRKTFSVAAVNETNATAGDIHEGPVVVQRFRAAEWSGYASMLGSRSAAVAVTTAAALLLVALRQWRTLAVVLTFAIVGGALVDPMKDFFRPVRALYPGMPALYPSGHTIGAMLQFGLLTILGAAALRRVGLAQAGLMRKAVIAWVVISVAVGLDRVVVGSHIFSDVLGAWAFGTAVICVAYLVDERLHRVAA